MFSKVLAATENIAFTCDVPGVAEASFFLNPAMSLLSKICHSNNPDFSAAMKMKYVLIQLDDFNFSNVRFVKHGFAHFVGEFLENVNLNMNTNNTKVQFARVKIGLKEIDSAIEICLQAMQRRAATVAREWTDVERVAKRARPNLNSRPDA